MLKQILPVASMRQKLGANAFTLLELIVTCSIIAAIALLSVPVYSKYRMRAKVATMISAASAAQFAVANDYFNQGYTFNNSTFAANSQPYLRPKSNFISSISVEKGWVRVTGNPEHLGGRNINVVLQPNVENNNVTWTCYVSSAYFEYAPESCRNQACAVYSWGPWQTIDQGTTWLYNANPGDVATIWSSYCASYPWYFGCKCYNASNTNLVRYQILHNVISNVDNGWGWTYLVVNEQCQQSTRELSVVGSCASCPGGSTCQDMFESLEP